MHGKNLTLTAIGRSIINKVQEKHNIKRIDRLLGNQYLYNTKNYFYALFIQKILQTITTTVIIVDWSVLRAKKFYLLRATIPFHGRSLTVYEKVYPRKEYNTAKAHKDFIYTLAGILPINFKPLIITDAGFKGPWFNLIENMGWNYISRIRGTTLYLTNQINSWVPCSGLHENKAIKNIYIGKVSLARTNPYVTNLYYCRQKSKHRKSRTKSTYYTIKNKEPWILASSIICSPKKIMFLYKTRMQIEESFRDLKSRLGFNLITSKTNNIQRFDILMLISFLATVITIIIGLIGKRNNLQFIFQANTIKTRNVLSIFFLGLRLFTKNTFPIYDPDLIYALNCMYNEILCVSV